MKNVIRNLLFLAILLFSISYDSFVYSEKYEKQKHHGGLDLSVCNFSGGYIYQNDWEVLGIFSFYLGIGVIFGSIAVWRRRKPIYDKRLSILQGELNGNWRNST